MSDATGFSMMSDDDYNHLRNELARSMGAAERHERREAAARELPEGEPVQYDGRTWLLLERHTDGRVTLESWDECVIVPATAVEPAD